MDISLHRHLDGDRSLLDLLPPFHFAHNKPYPVFWEQDHLKNVKEWFGNTLKGDIVKKFSLTTGVLQSFTTISAATTNCIESLAAQGIRYCEAIIAPQYLIYGGLTVEQVINALIHGIKVAEEKHPEIEFNLLLAIGRELDPNPAVELVEIFAKSERTYISGVTLVCDEAKYPPEKHTPMFKRAKDLGFKTACHAGEWVHNPDTEDPDFYYDLPVLLKNLRTAVLVLEVDRIEHGMALAYDPFLMEIIKERCIGITMCPSSYVYTELLPDNDIKILQIDKLIDTGVPITLDVDDDLFMDNMKEMMTKCQSAYNFTEEQKEILRVNAWSMRWDRSLRG